VDELIARAMGGDRDAFCAVVEGKIDRCYAIAMRVLRDRDRAEDAVQTTFLRAWQGLPTLRDTTRFVAWLYRLLLRSCFDESRRHRAARAAFRIVSIDASSPDGSASMADRDQLDRAMARLPIAQRAVVVLHHYQGLPLTETADALRIPLGTARSRLHYALQTLRAAVEADDRAMTPARRTA
jgi:RNA polymerase sigma-70 factor (ECF subfamily)